MLALSAVPATDRPRHIAAWSGAIHRGNATLWIGNRDGQVVAAMLAEVQPGRTAVVTCPQTSAGQPPEVAGAVLRRVVEQLHGGGVALVQAIPPTSTAATTSQFQAAGFEQACQLLYLVSVSADFPAVCPDDGLETIPFERRPSGSFSPHHTSELTKGRSIARNLPPAAALDDVLAGYRAVGTFDASRWLVVRNRGADVGCLLLADHPDANAWELVYMGVVPDARGRGLGVAIVRHAQWLTAQAGRERLTAAVDADNGPAIEAYAAAGFTGWNRRTVFLRSFA